MLVFSKLGLIVIHHMLICCRIRLDESQRKETTLRGRGGCCYSIWLPSVHSVRYSSSKLQQLTTDYFKLELSYQKAVLVVLKWSLLSPNIFTCASISTFPKGFSFVGTVRHAVVTYHKGYTQSTLTAVASVHAGCSGSAPQAGWGSFRGGGGSRRGQPREGQLTLGRSNRRLSAN